MKKRIFALLLALALSLGLCGQAFAAWEPEGEIRIGYGGTDRVDRMDATSNYASAKLGAPERGLCNLLKDKFAQVANGQLDNSIFTFDVSNLEIYNLGPGSMSADTGAVLRAILMECPYEQYWFNKTKGWSTEWNYNTYTNRVSTLTFKCHTTEDYARPVPGEDSYYIYQPDPNKTKAASAAVMANARAVVNQNSGKSDYEKLTAYKDYICSQVEYDKIAVMYSDSDRYYGAPWQLTFVFDNNPNTNVVCEGYAKAFKYLCDLSTFTSPVECYLADGTMDGGDHMWNLVRVNGKSYMADVTNSDSEWGGFGDLFLAGAANATGDGFTINAPRHDLSNKSYPARSVSYRYRDELKSLFGSGLLTLAPTGLSAPATPTTPTTPTQPPALSGLKTDFKNLALHELSRAGASGGGLDDAEYTLGSTGADVSVLVLGGYDCGKTDRAFKAAKTAMEELGVRKGRLYRVEIKHDGLAGQGDTRRWAKEHDTELSYARMIASGNSRSPYNSVFWDITRACDGTNSEGSVMPAVVVLDKECRPIYYASEKTFDANRLRAALSYYAGGSFGDVKPGAFYAKAVNWAVAGSVTNGTTATQFSPAQTCTHAQILTFLWRAMGEPLESWYNLPPGVSLSPNHFACDAIRWAFAKGLTVNLMANGGPNAPCTRAQAMDYIWAAFGRPSGGSASFSDVPAYYAGAVSWAVNLGITNGTGSGKFSPNKVCDRGTIVTFLHRAFVEEARVK